MAPAAGVAAAVAQAIQALYGVPSDVVARWEVEAEYDSDDDDGDSPATPTDDGDDGEGVRVDMRDPPPPPSPPAIFLGWESKASGISKQV